jgi:uncharacterized protein YndB with AHSA1/START domain
MKADIDVTMTYPYPADRVWAALTSSEALSAWFMPNDFKPAVGHRFTFRARPFRAWASTALCAARSSSLTRRSGWCGPGRAATSTRR